MGELPEYVVHMVAGPTPTVLRQLVVHDPTTGAEGDCYRTCVASILGLADPADVPHFIDQRRATGDLPWEEVRLARLWLREHHGLDLGNVCREAAEEADLPYIATVRSRSGPWNHAVVAWRGGVWCDPIEKGHTLDELADEAVEVLARPYEPGPDEQVALWRSLPLPVEEVRTDG